MGDDALYGITPEELLRESGYVQKRTQSTTTSTAAKRQRRDDNASTRHAVSITDPVPTERRTALCRAVYEWVNQEPSWQALRRDLPPLNEPAARNFDHKLDVYLSAGQVLSEEESLKVLQVWTLPCSRPTGDADDLHERIQRHAGHWRAAAPVSGHYCHASMHDLACVLQHTTAVDQMVLAFEDASVTSPSLLLGLNATARHILQASEWRQQPEADRVVTLVTRLSALPVPSLDALGAAGKWWLSAGAQVYGRSECIYEALRELCGVLSEQALDRLAPEVRRGRSEESAIKQWFALRTYQLVNLRTLTAAFLSYLFAPHMARLEYTPLSFARRPFGVTEEEDSSASQLDDRASRLLTCDEHLLSVWSAEGGQLHDVFNAKGLTVAAFYRAFDRNRDPRRVVPTNAMPHRAVACEWTHTGSNRRDEWEPLEAFRGLLDRYVRQCLRVELAPSAAIPFARRRLFPWQLGRNCERAAAARDGVPYLPRAQDKNPSKDTLKAVAILRKRFEQQWKVLPPRYPGVPRIVNWHDDDPGEITVREALRMVAQKYRAELPKGIRSTRRLADRAATAYDRRAICIDVGTWLACTENQY